MKEYKSFSEVPLPFKLILILAVTVPALFSIFSWGLYFQINHEQKSYITTNGVIVNTIQFQQNRNRWKVCPIYEYTVGGNTYKSIPRYCKLISTFYKPKINELKTGNVTTIKYNDKNPNQVIDHRIEGYKNAASISGVFSSIFTLFFAFGLLTNRPKKRTQDLG